jgi:hypothetical protein
VLEPRGLEGAAASLSSANIALACLSIISLANSILLLLNKLLHGEQRAPAGDTTSQAAALYHPFSGKRGRSRRLDVLDSGSFFRGQCRSTMIYCWSVSRVEGRPIGRTGEDAEGRNSRDDGGLRVQFIFAAIEPISQHFLFVLLSVAHRPRPVGTQATWGTGCAGGSPSLISGAVPSRAALVGTRRLRRSLPPPGMETQFSLGPLFFPRSLGPTNPPEIARQPDLLELVVPSSRAEELPVLFVRQ